MSNESPTTHYTIQQLDDGIQVVLPSKKNYFVIAWFIMLSFFWVFMSCSVVYFLSLTIITTSGFLDDVSLEGIRGFPSPTYIVLLVISILLLLFWGYYIAYTLLWQFFGREVIEVNYQTMRVSRRILGWKKTSEYLSKNVKNLRASIRSKSIFTPQWDIAFDHKEKTFRFGLFIYKGEANQIISILNQYFLQRKEKATKRASTVLKAKRKSSSNAKKRRNDNNGTINATKVKSKKAG